MEIIAQTVETGDVEKLKEFLESGTKDKSDLGFALIQASEMKQWECVKLLIEAGADVNTTSHHNFSPLNYATLSGNVECVELLINAGADVNFYNRTTCLNLADNFEIAKMLIKAGANVNSSTYEDSITPFIGAASEGRSDLVKLCLDSGADVNYSCMFGTALEGAVGGGNPDCVKLLVRQTENTHGPFAQAAQYGKLECLKVLLESGIDVNSKISIYEQRKENKVTALMKAASGGHIGCIEFLINRGASVHTIDDYGNNVLMFASMECKFKAMNFFIRFGIDINATNKQKETALMKVISQPYERPFLGGIGSWQQNDCKSECVRLLVESGADVNRQSVSGDTALILAAKQNQSEYIKILLEADSCINIFNKRGFNALMSHIEESKVKSDDLQGLLIAAGESKKKFKWKPLKVPRSIRRPKFRGCLKLLCAKGNHETKTKGGIMVSDIDWNCWLDEESNEEVHSLKELCRDIIRKCLLQLNPFNTLFNRAPLLKLPRVLTSFMLYDFDLEVKEMESENEKELSSE